MKSRDELLSMIDRQMEKYADSVDSGRDRVGFARWHVLKLLRNKIAESCHWLYHRTNL